MVAIAAASGLKDAGQGYAQHTGQSLDQVHADLEGGRFFKRNEAIEYGLIDRVIEHRYAR